MKLTSITLTIFTALIVPVRAAEESLPKKLEFEITNGVNPAQAGRYSGKVSFERDDTANVFKVTWTLTDGSTTTGWGVPFPKSGAMAVAYGKNAAAVAIYRKDGDKIDARWAPAKDGSPIGEYGLQRGKAKNQFVMTGGAKGGVTLTPAGEIAGLAALQFDLPSGKTDGFAIASGDFLAAASHSGGMDTGIVLYQFTPDLKVSGKWYLPGAKGLGTEDLKLLTIDGKAPPAAATGAAGPAAEVQELAAKIRGKKDALLTLKPTKEQIALIAASAEDALALAAYTDKIFSAIPDTGLDGKADQTEIRAFTGGDLPGGYAKHAAHFKKDLAVYGFKLLKPGESAGMSFDGLVKLNGQWVMVPKMWRAFE